MLAAALKAIVAGCSPLLRQTPLAWSDEVQLHAELVCPRFHCSTAKLCPVIDYRSRLNSREPSSLQRRDALPFLSLIMCFMVGI
jgi:hypothetical protein